jgi:hypothetical protein
LWKLRASVMPVPGVGDWWRRCQPLLPTRDSSVVNANLPAAIAPVVWPLAQRIRVSPGRPDGVASRSGKPEPSVAHGNLPFHTPLSWRQASARALRSRGSFGRVDEKPLGRVAARPTISRSQPHSRRCSPRRGA